MRRTSSFALAVLCIVCLIVAGSNMPLPGGALDVGKESIATARFPGVLQAERSVRTLFFQDMCLFGKGVSLVCAHSWFVPSANSC